MEQIAARGSRLSIATSGSTNIGVRPQPRHQTPNSRGGSKNETLSGRTIMNRHLHICVLIVAVWRARCLISKNPGRAAAFPGFRALGSLWRGVSAAREFGCAVLHGSNALSIDPEPPFVPRLPSVLQTQLRQFFRAASHRRADNPFGLLKSAMWSRSTPNRILRHRAHVPDIGTNEDGTLLWQIKFSVLAAIYGLPTQTMRCDPDGMQPFVLTGLVHV